MPKSTILFERYSHITGEKVSFSRDFHCTLGCCVCPNLGAKTWRWARKEMKHSQQEELVTRLEGQSNENNTKYRGMQRNSWNWIQVQRHEKELKWWRNIKIQWCYAVQLRSVVALGMFYLWSWMKNAQVTLHGGQERYAFHSFPIVSNNKKIKTEEYACLQLYSPSGLFWVFHGNTVGHFCQMTADHQ